MKRTLAFIVALLTVTLGTASTTAAQCPVSSSIYPSMKAQLVQNLADSTHQDDALMLTLELTRRDCLDADTEVVEALLDVYEQNERDEKQLMSAVILGELGDRQSLFDLYRLRDQEDSETVRRVTLAVLKTNQMVATR